MRSVHSARQLDRSTFLSVTFLDHAPPTPPCLGRIQGPRACKCGERRSTVETNSTLPMVCGVHEECARRSAARSEYFSLCHFSRPCTPHTPLSRAHIQEARRLPWTRPTAVATEVCTCVVLRGARANCHRMATAAGGDGDKKRQRFRPNRPPKPHRRWGGAAAAVDAPDGRRH